MSQEQDFYTPSEAVEYLKNERGLIFSVAGLRNRRTRGKLRATARRVLANNTLWTKAELDAIQPSKLTRRVPVDGNDGQKNAVKSSEGDVNVMLIGAA